MRLGTLAAVSGVLAGVWAMGGEFAFSAWAYGPFCTSDVCFSAPGWFSLGVGVVGGILVLSSLAGFFGPRRSFYVGAASGGAIVVLLLAVWGEVGVAFYWSLLILALVAGTLSVLAARSRTALSEQSNPMNLPVFG
ncbi:MAG: hypothetical protein HY247_04325 [archaeon]|nr:MAG: hypothetical protein HY247_04325 [archaeon]